ncbi:IS1634 family transposase [Calothrix sp. CCY 0018]|uniref:DUF4277 domain-containing protein n=1 Tax=Calothrix sp. CCY 0018 TaxID=3103864 RepID=UPI0039C5E821
MSTLEEIEIKNIDHLGIVAGIIDSIGLVEIVNEFLGEDISEKISAGHVVKAMILNGLGFVSAPLYMFSRFFEHRACEHLIGEGVKPEYLNDDKLGRTMDKLFSKGLSSIFLAISLNAVKNFDVSFYHLEATLSKNEAAITNSVQSAGRFVLATNILDEKILSNSEMISEYKAQQSCERGFGFLKDPLFFADSIFLKTPKRIEALTMIMALCLLVYTIAQ